MIRHPRHRVTGNRVGTTAPRRESVPVLPVVQLAQASYSTTPTAVARFRLRTFPASASGCRSASRRTSPARRSANPSTRCRTAGSRRRRTRPGCTVCLAGRFDAPDARRRTPPPSPLPEAERGSREKAPSPPLRGGGWGEGSASPPLSASGRGVGGRGLPSTCFARTPRG